MILLLALAPAFAGDVLLSGGLSATPTAADLLTPSWRLGVDAGRVTPWVTVSYASFDYGTGRDAITGFLLLPRLGARIDLGERGDHPVTFVGVTATTRIGNASAEGDAAFDKDLSPLLPLGGGASVGLDAPVTAGLSLSAEIGGEVFHAGWKDRFVQRFWVVDTVASVHVNLWL